LWTHTVRTVPSQKITATAPTEHRRIKTKPNFEVMQAPLVYLPWMPAASVAVASKVCHDCIITTTDTTVTVLNSPSADSSSLPLSDYSPSFSSFFLPNPSCLPAFVPFFLLSSRLFCSPSCLPSGRSSSRLGVLNQ
jgi:hypothetical protein